MFNLIKLYRLPVCIGAFILYTVLTVLGGWQIHTYYTGYKENLDHKVEMIVKEGISNYQKEQAQNLIDQKDLLRSAAGKVQLKERTIIQQPIYMKTCINEAGAELLKQYKKESADIINGKVKK